MPKKYNAYEDPESDLYEGGDDGDCCEESNRVRDLDKNEAVDVCYGRDGISDDCFVVTDLNIPLFPGDEDTYEPR